MDLLNLLLHLNLFLPSFIQTYGTWSILFLCCIIFMETGFVITPFLPGDSLLFTAGSAWAISGHSIFVLVLSLSLAAFLGDNLNYFLGRHWGRRFFHPQAKILNSAYLVRTENFYQKYGPLALILARFIPLIRSFCPFVAGLGKMSYPLFFGISLLAAGIWIAGITYSGYFFGNIPWVQKHFSEVLLGIILISLLPILLKIAKHGLSTISKPPKPLQ